MTKAEREAKAMRRIIDAARYLKAGRDERRARVKAFLEAAAKARKGGPNGPDVIASVEHSHPIVHDVGNGVEMLCDALEGYDKITGHKEAKS